MRVFCLLLLCCVYVASAIAEPIGYSDGVRLLKFAEDNDEGSVTLLLEQGVDPNTREDEHGRTALHFAAKGGNLGVIKLLLKFGADINARAKTDSTALHYSANMGHLDVTNLLLKRGADVDARNEFGRTSLQYAANFKHIDISRLLLDAGADINAVDTSGRSALHYAASASHPDTVKLLLDRGISRDLKTQRGETALDLTDSNDVRTLLQTHFPTDL